MDNKIKTSDGYMSRQSERKEAKYKAKREEMERTRIK